MSRLSKVILISLGIVVLVGLGAVFAVNLYVQSPSTQARIQDEISRALRIPIDITNASVTPWGGLKINGITVPGEAGNFMEASSFSARYRLLPLLKRKLVITAMVLEGPRIVWEQGPEGQWVLPALPDTGEKKRAKTAAAEAGQPAPEKRKDGFQVKVEGFEILNGHIEFHDRKGHRIASAENVHMVYSFPDTERVQGTVEIAKLIWKDSLHFHTVRSPFSYHKGDLALSDVKGTLGGGKVAGKLTIQPEKKEVPFDLNLGLARVDIAIVSAEAGWPAGQAAGSLSGELQLAGNGRKMDKTKGEGELTLENGQFRQFEFFQTLGQVLQIEELANFRLKEGRAVFKISDERTHIEELVLAAPDLKLSAQGTAKFDGKLAMDAELAVSPRLAKQLPSFVRDNMTPVADDGSRAIPFKISGRTDKPRTNLLDQVVGQKIGSQFDDLVSNLFGIKKKDDKEPKKDKDKDKEKKKKKDDAKNKDKEKPAEAAPTETAEHAEGLEPTEPAPSGATPPAATPPAAANN